MNILYDEQTGVFSLTTANTLYQMKADSNGVLLHLFYGEKTASDMSYLIRYTDRGFSGNPYECAENRGYSLDTLPQEYSGNGKMARYPEVCQFPLHASIGINQTRRQQNKKWC